MRTYHYRHSPSDLTLFLASSLFVLFYPSIGFEFFQILLVIELKWLSFLTRFFSDKQQQFRIIPWLISHAPLYIFRYDHCQQLKTNHTEF